MFYYLNRLQVAMEQVQLTSFLASIALRLYLIPVMWGAANTKWDPFNPDSSLQNTIAWFAHPEWGLGLPFPTLLAYLTWGTEYIGAILLALGLGVRWVCLPLMITMLVAAFLVHWDNGWLAIAAPNEQLAMAKSLLAEHGNYDWLTATGSFVILNNGIEFAMTYFIMLLALFFLGGGHYFSIDYYIKRYIEQRRYYYVD